MTPALFSPVFFQSKLTPFSACTFSSELGTNVIFSFNFLSDEIVVDAAITSPSA
jgi:hypothetical protein